MALRVGLDLGASRLKVGVSVDGASPVPLRFRDGREYLPTLAFVPVAGGALRVGDRAEDHLLLNGTMIVADLKGRLGDETIQVYAPGTPHGADLPERLVTPEEIATALFGAAMQSLREVHGEQIEGQLETVVTATRKALRLGNDDVLVRAAQAAGFGQPTVLEEPLAAARWWLHSEAAQATAGSNPNGLVIVVDVGSWSVDVALVRRRADGEVEAPLPALVEMFELGSGLVDMALSDLLAEHYLAAAEDEDPEAVPDRLRAWQPWLDREGRRLRDAVAQGQAPVPVYLQGRELRVTTDEVEALCRERLVAPLRTALADFLSRHSKLCAARQLPEAGRIVLCGGAAATPGLLAALQELCGTDRPVHRLEPAAHAVSLGAVCQLEASQELPKTSSVPESVAIDRTQPMPRKIDHEGLTQSLSEWRVLAAGLRLPVDDPALARAEARWRADRFDMALLGEVKQGKSSFGNALLGQAGLLPTAEEVATSVALTVAHGPFPAWRVHRLAEPGGSVPEPQSISRAELAAFATETGNPANIRRVDFVAVEAPSPLLSTGLQLTDLPGLGGLVAEHAELVWRFLPGADVVLFVVAAREAPLTEVELGMVREAAEITQRLVFVQTMADLAGGREALEAFRARNLRLLSHTLDRPEEAIPYFVVSSKRKEEADMAADATQLRRSGFPALISYLEREVVAHKRDALGEIVAARLSELTNTLLLPAIDERLRVAEASGDVGAEAAEAAIADASTRLDEFRTVAFPRIAARLDRGLTAVASEVRRVLERGLDPVGIAAAAIAPYAANQKVDANWIAKNHGAVRDTALGACSHALRKVTKIYVKRAEEVWAEMARELGAALPAGMGRAATARVPVLQVASDLSVRGDGIAKLTAAPIGALQGGAGGVAGTLLIGAFFPPALLLAPFALKAGAVVGAWHAMSGAALKRREEALAMLRAALEEDLRGALSRCRAELDNCIAQVETAAREAMEGAVNSRAAALASTRTEALAARDRTEAEAAARRAELNALRARAARLTG